MIFDNKKILNSRVKIKTKKEPLDKYIEDAYVGKGYEDLLLRTATAINLNHTSLKVAEKLCGAIPESFWRDEKIHERRILNLFGDSGFLEKYIVRSLLRNENMIRRFPDYYQRLFHILHNMIFSVAKTNAASYWLRKIVYYSADASMSDLNADGFDNGNYPAVFHGRLFSMGDDEQKLESYKRNGNIKSPYVPGVIGEDKIFNYPLLDWVNSGKQIDEYAAILFWDVFTEKDYLSETDIEEIKAELGEKSAREARERQEKTMAEMKKKINGFFDVIIGNPPYNINDEETGKVKSTVYQLFCQAAEELNPKYTSFIIPSKWMYGKANGKGMTDFTKSILTGNSLTYLELMEGSEAFPSVDTGEVAIYTKELSRKESSKKVVFCDHGEKKELESIDEITIANSSGEKHYKPKNSIVDKILIKKMKSLESDTKVLVYENGLVYDKFGHDILGHSAVGFKHDGGREVTFPDGNKGKRPMLSYSLERDSKHTMKVYIPRVRLHKGDFPNKESDKKISHLYAEPSVVTNYRGNLFKTNKLVVTSLFHYKEFSLDYPYNAFILKPGEIAPAMFSIGNSIQSNQEIENLQKYLKTRFVTYLVWLNAVSQSFNSNTLTFVPYMDFTREWMDSDLNTFFGLDEKEIGEINRIWSEFNKNKGQQIKTADEEDPEEEAGDSDNG